MLLILLIGTVILGFVALTEPWGFYMGGRFHAIPMWQGVGRLHSNSGGGEYTFYVWFWPYHGRFRSLAYVQGNAMVCSPRGEKFFLRLGGDFDRPAGHDLNGQRSRLYMFNRNSVRRILGTDRRPELELRGKWNGPEMVMDDHGSIARSFDAQAKLYPDSKNRPYISEVSPITLHEGTKSDFEAACSQR